MEPNQNELNEMRKIVERRNDSLKGGMPWRVFDTVITLIAVVIFALAARAVIAEPVRVSGESMLDTLQDGDYLFVEKLSYTFSSPKRGDVVICYYPDPYYESQNKDYYTRVKRVVAVAGDTVETRDGRLYVNGEAVEEPYLTEKRSATAGIETPVTVQKGTVFVLGDNRINSRDSRDSRIGAIPLEQIVGKPHFVLFPLSHFHGVTIWN